jgi:hypothetical protein
VTATRMMLPQRKRTKTKAEGSRDQSAQRQAKRTVLASISGNCKLINLVIPSGPCLRDSSRLTKEATFYLHECPSMYVRPHSTSSFVELH